MNKDPLKKSKNVIENMPEQTPSLEKNLSSALRSKLLGKLQEQLHDKSRRPAVNETRNEDEWPAELEVDLPLRDGSGFDSSNTQPRYLTMNSTVIDKWILK